MSGNDIGRDMIRVGKRHVSGVLVLLLSSVVPAFAQGSRANPYQNLFKPPDLKAAARAQPRAQDARSSTPRVVGAMPLIPLDPCVDPKIFIGQRPVCK